MDTTKLNSPEKAIERLTNRLMPMRKREEIQYLPYTDLPGYKITWPSFNFSEVLTDLNVGDVVYAAAEFPGPYERDMLISLTGDTEISFNGIQPRGYANRGMSSYPVKFREGKNELIVKYKVGTGIKKFEIYIGTEEMPVFFPNGYIYNTRPVIPVKDLKGFVGFAYSRIYNSGEELPQIKMDAIEWVGPTYEKTSDKIIFDFTKKTSLNCTTAVSWGRGEISFKHKGHISVIANNKRVYEGEDGCFKMSVDEETLFLVASRRTEKGFGFSVDSGQFRLPFYATEEKDLSWLWLDGVILGPDALQFKLPYTNEIGEKVFFNFYRPKTYLRLYLNTAFFGQWFYAVMVGEYGMLKMAERLNKKELIDYFIDSVSILEDYFEYAKMDQKRTGVTSLLPHSIRLNHLDSIGTIGMNVCELIRLTDGKKGKKLLSILENALNDVPRTEDGIFYRIKTFWTDDFFMFVPFFARLALVTGKNEYFSEAANQIRGLYRYLYMEDKQIFSHIYFVEEKKQNKVPWGRGNGWVMFALSEILMLMPKSHKDYPDLLERFQKLSEGILRCQGKLGMWHQVIDDDTTYEECSGTGMFIIALARGVKNGWLNLNIRESIIRAWNRMSSICLSGEGDLLNVCVGSGCHLEREYYRKLGACINDDHGTGVFLLAATEILDLI